MSLGQNKISVGTAVLYSTLFYFSETIHFKFKRIWTRMPLLCYAKVWGIMIVHIPIKFLPFTFSWLSHYTSYKERRWQASIRRWHNYKSFCSASILLAIFSLSARSCLVKNRNYYWHLKKHGIMIPRSSKKPTLANMTSNQTPPFPLFPSNQVGSACTLLFCNQLPRLLSNCWVNWRKILKMSNWRL